MKVRLIKLAESPQPVARAAQWSHFIPGESNAPYSLPVSYTLEGELIHPIEVSEPMAVFRSKRNGIVAPGLFESSIIVAIDGDRIETKNSVYRLEYI